MQVRSIPVFSPLVPLLVPFELVPYLNAASFVLSDRGDSDLKKALFYINDPADFNEGTT